MLYGYKIPSYKAIMKWNYKLKKTSNKLINPLTKIPPIPHTVNWT